VKSRLPTMGPRTLVGAGVLMSDGADGSALFRRAAGYDARTPKGLGLTIPSSLLLRANHVVE
jgi:hypothetical protein